MIKSSHILQVLVLCLSVQFISQVNVIIDNLKITQGPWSLEGWHMHGAIPGDDLLEFAFQFF